jgi:hypothetical protein
VPELNWEAQNFKDIINWEELSWAELIEPAATAAMSEEELKLYIKSPLFLHKLYCHTQCVERAVKLVYNSAKHFYNAEDRHGAILAGCSSRAKRSRIYAKKSYEEIQMDFFYYSSPYPLGLMYVTEYPTYCV